MEELLRILMEAWGVQETIKVINQITTPNEYLGEKYFKDREGVYADNFKIDLLRGDAVIMEAVPSGAPRTASKDGSVHRLPIELARFTDEKVITVKDIKHLRNIQDPEKRAEAFASLIGSKQGQMKSKFSATKEFLRMGAILGTVVDGSGKELFKFDSELDPMNLKNINPEGKFEEYEDNLVAEFGASPGYKAFVDRSLYTAIWDYAVANDMTGTNGTVKKVVVDGIREIDFNGTVIRPVTAKYRDKHGNVRSFLESNSGVLVPDSGAFKEFYTHAEHMEAIEGAPTEYFSKAEELEDGNGVKVIAESVSIPVCVRPYAVRKLTWA